MITLKHVIDLFRVRQWIKNLFVFAPLLFAKRLFDVSDVQKTLVIFFAFCFLSSALYVINDIVDLPHDKLHPVKKNRPIARGAISKQAAGSLALILFLAAFMSSFSVGITVSGILFLHFILIVWYTFSLKHIVIADVMAISFGFVLRVFAGGTAIDVPISSWILMCGFLLTLFLALSKRRQEFNLINGESMNGQNNTRRVLDHYSIPLLDSMIIIVLSATLISYFLYTFNVDQNDDRMMLTTPFVLYGVFRYLFLLNQKKISDDPTGLILSDRPLLMTIFFWVLVSSTILYFS